MLLAPAVIFLLAFQSAPPPLGGGQELDTRLDGLRRSGNWSALADALEALPPRERAERFDQLLVVLGRSGRWARLLEVCEGPVSTPFYYRGRALSELGRHAESLAWYFKAGASGQTLAFLEASNEAQALGDWKAMEAAANGLLEKYPLSGNYLGLKGQALTKQGRFKEAEASLNESIHLLPKAAMSWADLACCYNEETRYQEAYDTADHALTLEPKLMEGWCNRGRACIGLKRYQDGRNDFAAALALGPKDPILVRNLKLNISMADKFLAYQAAKPARRAAVKP